MYVLFNNNNNNIYHHIKNLWLQWLEFDPSLAYCRAERLENLAQDGYTLLHVAAKYNNLEAMRVLLEYKYVSTWAVDLQGR